MNIEQFDVFYETFEPKDIRILRTHKQGKPAIWNQTYFNENNVFTKKVDLLNSDFQSEEEIFTRENKRLKLLKNNQQYILKVFNDSGKYKATILKIESVNQFGNSCSTVPIMRLDSDLRYIKFKDSETEIEIIRSGILEEIHNFIKTNGENKNLF